MTDLGERFVKATYNLEGDGALMVDCYEEITKLQALLNSANYPNIVTVAKNIAPGNPATQHQWIMYALSCVKPGLDYFVEKFGDNTKPPLSQFKTLRYFALSRIFEIQPSVADISSLTLF